MRIVKPLRLGLLKRSLLWGGRTLLSFGVVTAFPFGAPRALLQEGEMWEAITPILGDRPLDTGEPKARGEVVVFGSYHAPGGTPVLQHGARIRVGPIDKSIRLTGRREWRRSPDRQSFATSPAPFTSMPLDDWRLAFGGPQFPGNPCGIGFWREDTFTDDGRYPLPCLEYPGSVMNAPTDVIPPACFGPRDVTIPDRQQFAGTYDRHWAENHAPGLAADATLDLFQVAPPDQQIAGFFAGTESVLVENMHPATALQTAQLPGVRPRLFARRRDDGGQRLDELALQADTLVLFPEISLAVLIHRIDLWVTAFDHPEIDLVVAGFEWQEQPVRPIGHYAADLARRLDPDDGFKLGLDHGSLCPDGWQEPSHEKASWFKVARPADPTLPPRLQAMIDAATARLEAAVPPEVLAGMTAAAAAYEPPGLIKSLQAELDAFKAAAKTARDPRSLKPQMDRIETLTRQVVDQAAGELQGRARAMAAKAGLDYDVLAARAAADTPSTPRAMIARADAEIERVAAAAPPAMRERILASKPGAHLEFVDQAMADIASLQARMRAQIGHLMPAVTAGEPGDAARRLAALTSALQSGGPLDTRDFAGLDLSGLDFRHRDLSEADLAGCRLAGARFDGAILVRSNLAGAVLDGASFANANLTETNLGRTSLNRTRFAGALIERSQFGAARGECTDFTGARLVRIAAMDGVTLPSANFDGAEMTDVTFMASTLDDAAFGRARLEKVSLIGCRADRARFEAATLTRCTLVNCRLHDADFGHAVFDRLSTAGTCDFTGSRFDRARMPAACLIGASLPNTSWVATNLSSALFNQCDLRAARFRSALLANGSFMRADLRHADLRGADLAGASLIRADLSLADLACASLYGADLTGTVLDEAQLDDALLDLTRLAGPNFPADAD